MRPLMAQVEPEPVLGLPSADEDGTLPSQNLLSTVVVPTTDHCVICLDVISEKAIALPCRHEQFDFPCLGTWLQRQQVCPLCKSEVQAIRFNVSESNHDGTKIFYLPAPEEASPHRNIEAVVAHQRRHGRARQQQRWLSRGMREGTRQRRYSTTPTAGDLKATALAFRRNVYRDALYSLHVGSNRISRYRTIAPSSFQTDEHLVSRARTFIRRELSVFDFLSPGSSSSSSSGSTDRRRANNADFLLEYIISILKSIDLKGSTGQAEELLSDFLGRENARVFIHELQAWLRSPFERLEDWDRNVQYAIPTAVTEKRDEEGSSLGVNVKVPPRSSSSNGERAPASTVVPQWFSDRFVLGDRRRLAQSDPP